MSGAWVQPSAVMVAAALGKRAMQLQVSWVRRVKRGVLVAAGLACVGLAAAGAVLPGLPTTVFLLAASFFFARSSPRLQRWLVEHPRLGPYLTMVRSREMPLRAKVVTLVVMWVGIGASVATTAATRPLLAGIILAAGLVGTGVVAFWLRTAKLAKVGSGPA